MKRFLPLLLINTLVAGLIVFLSSCEGPQGATGPAGTNGTNGNNGINGIDANSFCKVCHNTATKNQVTAEWATSKHASGSTWATEGINKTCVACHSQQGYIETTFTGLDTMAVPNKIGYPLGCDGCHTFHNTLDSNEFPDYALRFSSPFNFRLFTKVQYVANKNSYLCAKCHQPRLASPMPTSTTDTNYYTTTSVRYGIHYGAQAVTFSGKGAFEFSGEAYSNGTHTNALGCGDCHMAKTLGSGLNSAGGHTYRMADTTGHDNVAGCLKCHPGATTFDMDGKQTEIANLIKQLGDKIDALPGGPSGHMLEKVNGVYSGNLNIPATNPGGPSQVKVKLRGKYFAAIINFQILIRDKSNGAHNYKYMKALVDNTLASLP